MKRVYYILFLLSIVSGHVLRKDYSAPPEILIETNPTTDYASLPKPFKMGPLILQQGTNVIYKPQFILPAMNIPFPLANSHDKEDCKTNEGPEIDIVLSEGGNSKEPLTFLETPTAVEVEVSPSYIASDPIVSEIIEAQPIQEIPAAPTLPPFIMPELPQIEVVQEPSRTICEEEFLIHEQPMPASESEPLETQPAPTLPPFLLPELQKIEIIEEPKTSAPAPQHIHKLPEVLLIVEESVTESSPEEIPMAPTLSPFVMPELPKVEVLSETLTPCQYCIMMED